MSTLDKLNYLMQTKDLIKAAIIAKGVSVTDADTFRSYAAKIQSIEGSGGSGNVKPSPIYKPLDFLSTVLDENDCTNPYKYACLITDRDDAYTWSASNGDLNSKFYFSDGGTAQGDNVSHTWDKTQDLDYGLDGIYRWLIVTRSNAAGYLKIPSNVLAVVTRCNIASASVVKQAGALHAIRFENGAKWTTASLNYAGFYGCGALRFVEGLDLSNVTNLTSAFSNATGLTILSSVSNIKTGIDLGSCTQLTKASVINIINALVDRTDDTSLTCRLSNASYNLLNEQEIAIATNKNWSIIK